jgi:16S rRNA G966 N2-methylase RsmD
MSEYPTHPAADLWPMMDAGTLASLAENIRSDGLKVPIVLHRGMVLDGRNRLAACRLAGVVPRFVHDDECNPWRASWSLNRERRHMEDKVRLALIGEEYLAGSDAWEQERTAAREAANRARSEATKQQPRQDGGLFGSTGVASREATPVRTYTKEQEQAKTAARVAAEVGVSRASVERARELKTKAPEVAAKVVAGEVQGSKAHRAVKHEEARARVHAQAAAAPERAILVRADQWEFCDQFEPHSIDLLLTDPPYATDVENIESFAYWLKHWTPKLKPTGRAFVCIGAYPREVLTYLEVLRQARWLDRMQFLAWTYRNTIGPTPSHHYKSNWQMVLHLQGRDAPPLDCPLMVEQFAVQDINAPDGRQGNRYHEWQKPDELAERFIRHASKPGDLVVDPFAGSGTFLLAAARLGRRAVGCDIDERALRVAVERGCGMETRDAA